MYSTSYDGQRGDPSAIRPVLIGPANALEMTGAPWAYWRRHAMELGLEIVAIGSKHFIRAADLDAMVASRTPPKIEPTTEDEIAAMRERVRRAG